MENNLIQPHLIITKYSVYRDKKVIPFSMDFEVNDRSELFVKILTHARFKEHLQKEKDKVFKGAEDTEYNRNLLNEFLEDCKGAHPKITIKIELEKYGSY